MEKINSYQDLKVWQRAMELAELVYKHTSKFPKEETYGLTSQLRRASVSIAANIAEGRGRNTLGEFAQFLGIARGLLAELETLLILSQRLGYTQDQDHHAMIAFCTEVSKMIVGLKKSIAAGN